MISQDEGKNILWAQSVNENLRERIDDWLYPKNGNYGWYRSSDTSPDEKFKKACAILNEKWLSANMHKHGVKIIDSSQNIVISYFLRLYSIFRQIILKK
jgi:hypothetical protein